VHVSTVTPKHINLKYSLRKRTECSFFNALPETFSAILAPISATALLRSDRGSALGLCDELLTWLINFGMNICRKRRCHEIFNFLITLASFVFGELLSCAQLFRDYLVYYDTGKSTPRKARLVAVGDKYHRMRSV
jgi:hypothetical protein